MKEDNKKDNKCMNCVHWRMYEFCNHWKEHHCENKDSSYYLQDTRADIQCSEFERKRGE